MPNGMESGSELDSYLARFREDGSDLGPGDFTLDPRRALELLREQGGVGANAPLFLFRAIYQQTQGARVVWKKGLFDYQIRWDEAFGTLPAEAMRILAEGSFKAYSIRLKFSPGCVSIANADHFTSPLSGRFEETFKLAEPRLRHYPVDGLYLQPERGQPWLHRCFDDGEVELRRTDPEPQALHWVVDGIEFTESCLLPLNVTIFDDELKCDLSLSRVPESDRKSVWTERAQALLEEELEAVFGDCEPVKLDLDHLNDRMRRALEFLPFIETLPTEHVLQKKVFEKVSFRDVFGQYWSLSQLLESQNTHESLLVVPSIPSACPKSPMGERPVLHWRGDTKLYGESVFRRVLSGAGYIYSLHRGESLSTGDATILQSVEWESGSLGVRAPGVPDTRCEVEIVGKRRGSETIYLEEPAPSRLRLLWRSNEEIAHWSESEKFQIEFRSQVLQLLELAFAELGLNEEWLREVLVWVAEVAPLLQIESLRKVAFLESVNGKLLSPDEVEKAFPDGVVRVLEERSASLPKELPYPEIMWSHPLLSALGFETSEESRAVRRAYWREEGRERWLSRFNPSSTEEWAEEKGLSLSTIDGKAAHYYAPLSDPQALSVLVIRREGRTLGENTLTKDEFPPGYVLVLVDDSFPGDEYWSGPDREALSRLGPWLKKMAEVVRG